MNYQVHTFGCKVNTYDSGLIEKRLKQDPFVGDENSKVHIINSCAVTAEATKEAIKMARKIKSHDPFAVVVATGCAAQVDSEILGDSTAIDLVIANSHKNQIGQLIESYFKRQLNQKIWKSNIFKKEDLEPGGGIESHHKRAFLKIQDGCNSFCSFCIIPYARGKSRSLSISDLVLRVRDLVEQGFKEVVLTGVHIGDYEDKQLGKEKKLDDLVEALLMQTKVERLRLSSLEPQEISSHLFSLFSDKRLCPHFHMSIQSGSDSVLKEMKRTYTRKEIERVLNHIDSHISEAFIGMDVIAGFPSETEDQFLETYQLLSQLPWTRLHVFPYSERKGTRAAIMEQVPRDVRKKRALRLRELSQERYSKMALNQIGKIKKGLVVKAGQPLQALSRDYWTCLVEVDETSISGSDFLNKEVDVKIVGYQENSQVRMEGVLNAELL